MESTNPPVETPTTTSQESTPDSTQQQKGKKQKGEKGVDTKAQREAEKAARLAARQAKTQEQKEYKKDPNDPCANKFGDLELNRSQSDPELRYAKTFTFVHELDESKIGQQVIIRARLHSSRAASKKLVFVVIRERFATVQAVISVKEGEVSQGMVTYTSSIPKESIIEIKATVIQPSEAIKGCSQ